MLLALLLAATPERPPRPEPKAPVEAQCARSWDIDPGTPPPATLYQDGLAVCDATAVPTSQALDALELRAYADHLEAHVDALELRYRALELELAAVRSELAAETLRTTRMQAALDEPTPLVERPVVGVVAGVGLCAASGWAVGQAGR